MSKHIITKEELLALAETRLYDSIYLHDGIEREVVTNDWNKNGNDRTYIDVRCYKLSGKSAGTVRCGYYDNNAGEYVANNRRNGDYDIVDDDRN